MGDIVLSLEKSFERILRWAYPGLLFTLLLYLSKPIRFQELAAVLGFPQDTIWGLIIVGITIGAILYLFEANVVTQIWSSLAQYLHWESNTHPDVTQERTVKYPAPRGRFLKFLALKWFDPQAISVGKQASDYSDFDMGYMDYAWATYHATSVTGWLSLAFFFMRDSGSVLSSAGWLGGLLPAVLFIFFSLYQFARLTRVRHAESSEQK
jgi:hypothetical protein